MQRVFRMFDPVGPLRWQVDHPGSIWPIQGGCTHCDIFLKAYFDGFLEDSIWIKKQINYKTLNLSLKYQYINVTVNLTAAKAANLNFVFQVHRLLFKYSVNVKSKQICFVPSIAMQPLRSKNVQVQRRWAPIYLKFKKMFQDIKPMFRKLDKCSGN